MAQLEAEAASLAAQLRTFVAESQYELGAEWPEQIFKPVLGKKRCVYETNLEAQKWFLAFSFSRA